MGKNFLGLDGLKHFWTKAKTWIAEQITAEVTAKIAEIVANAPEDLDTLKEIADWISSHADDAAAMNTAISTNTSDIATLKTSVAGKADTGHTHTKSEITDFPTSLPANGGTADKTVNDITIDIPYVAESGRYVIPFGNILEPTSTEINSPYNWDITGFLSVIRSAGHAGGHLTFEAGHGYSHRFTTYAYLDEDNFTEAGPVEMSIKAFQYNGKWWLGLWISTQWQGYFGKMTITFSRGLPATPTCILYNSRSDGVANEEIYNSIQDIPSSWWRQRTICNPTSFSNTLHVDGLITPRQGTIDGATVSIGRSDGNITIGATENNNTGFTTINNDCKILKSLNVSGDNMISNFEGACNFNSDIFVHSKSLFPSGYIPRMYYMYGKKLNTLTTADKVLLKKLFAFMLFNRVSSLNFTLRYKINNTDSNKFINAVGYGFTDYEGIITIDNNDNITFSSDFSYNYCNLIGDNGEEGAYKVVDAYDLAGRLLKDDWANLTYLTFYGTFTLLEKL